MKECRAWLRDEREEHRMVSEGGKRKARGANRSRLKHTGKIRKGGNEDKEKPEGMERHDREQGKSKKRLDTVSGVQCTTKVRTPDRPLEKRQPISRCCFSGFV